MIIGCEMPQCIHNRNKRDTARQVLHGKHTLSLITAVSTGYGKREALCLFFVFWTELQRAGGGGGALEWLHLTRSSLHRQRGQTKGDG